MDRDAVTGAPEAPHLRFVSLDEAIEEMRRRGLRLSTPRRLILQALFAADGPVSAEYVARRGRVDVVSVYRNLDVLERHGLVHHVHLGHGPGLYVLLGRGEREYLFCDRCGAVGAVTPDQLNPVREMIEDLFGYTARFTHFPIVGVCARCACSPPSGTGPRTDTERQHSHGDHVHSHARDLDNRHEHPS